MGAASPSSKPRTKRKLMKLSEMSQQKGTSSSQDISYTDKLGAASPSAPPSKLQKVKPERSRAYHLLSIDWLQIPIFVIKCFPKSHS